MNFEDLDIVIIKLEDDSLNIQTPNGLINIFHLQHMGTQVAVYKSPDENPVGIIHLDESKR